MPVNNIQIVINFQQPTLCQQNPSFEKSTESAFRPLQKKGKTQKVTKYKGKRKVENSVENVYNCPY